MDYIQFGSTGLKVSRLAFGMSFIEQTDETKALTAVEAAIDRGINFFDCANVYAPYDDRSDPDAQSGFSPRQSKASEIAWSSPPRWMSPSAPAQTTPVCPDITSCAKSRPNREKRLPR